MDDAWLNDNASFTAGPCKSCHWVRPSDKYQYQYYQYYYTRSKSGSTGALQQYRNFPTRSSQASSSVLTGVLFAEWYKSANRNKGAPELKTLIVQLVHKANDLPTRVQDVQFAMTVAELKTLTLTDSDFDFGLDTSRTWLDYTLNTFLIHWTGMLWNINSKLQNYYATQTQPCLLFTLWQCVEPTILFQFIRHLHGPC